jgi:hypothetical protein
MMMVVVIVAMILEMMASLVPTVAWQYCKKWDFPFWRRTVPWNRSIFESMDVDEQTVVPVPGVSSYWYNPITGA